MERSIAYFAYSDSRFEIDLNLFNRYSADFLNEGNMEEEPFYLINEFDPQLPHPRETIEAFINFFETGDIDLTPENVFSIQFLSHKFRIPILSQITEQYINEIEHENKILDEIFSHPENLYEEQEKFISNRFEKLISDDRLKNLSLTQVYRIIPQKIRGEQLNDYMEERILDFLVDTEKKQAFILISLFKCSQKGRKRFYEELNYKRDIIDLNCIEQYLIESMINLLNYQEQKENEHEEEKKALKEQMTRTNNKIEDICSKFTKENNEIRNKMKEEEF
ncbi:hypothetical protein M9Y10_005770 [Tritrichomonas musculus]|uniref:BTB domain-containing protein n=1 Tax=Tritrichomonas musculus TaxID=1915356 RepID=A0ABR2JCY9_9EUKA